ASAASPGNSRRQRRREDVLFRRTLECADMVPPDQTNGSPSRQSSYPTRAPRPRTLSQTGGERRWAAVPPPWEGAGWVRGGVRGGGQEGGASQGSDLAASQGEGGAAQA